MDEGSDYINASFIDVRYYAMHMGWSWRVALVTAYSLTAMSQNSSQGYAEKNKAYIASQGETLSLL